MNLSSLSDLSLVAQVLAGANDRAFNRLVKKYQAPVRRFFMHQTLGDRMLSDDLAQETFILVYSNLAKFQQLSSFKTWLMKIAYRVWLDHIRSMHATEDMESVETAESSSKTRDSETTLDIITAMRRLTDIERTCVTLFYIEDMPHDKVAQITGLPVGTVRSHVCRGRQKLSSFLKQNGYGQ